MPNRWWKVALKSVAAALGIAVVLHVGGILMGVIIEWDGVFKARLTRASVDMRVIESTIDLYAKKYGHFPHEIADMLPVPGQPLSEATTLPMVPVSPWNTPYNLEIEHGPDGDRMKVWAVPDQKTRDKMHLTRLSNETFGIPSATRPPQ